VNLVLAGVEIIEESLGVQRAAGSGNCDEYSQGQRIVELQTGRIWPQAAGWASGFPAEAQGGFKKAQTRGGDGLVPGSYG
jgi:hypothetical protein